MKKDTQLIPYNLEAATVEALKAKYLDVTIQPDDKAAYAMVMSGLRECREIRLAVDAWHKEKKEWIVKAGKHYDAERRRIHALIAPIEDYLSAVRKVEDDRKEAIKIEADRKERERVEKLHIKIEFIRSFLIDAQTKNTEQIQAIIDELTEKTVTEEEFQEFAPEAMKIHADTLNALNQSLIARRTWEQEQIAAKIEAERLAKIRAEQEAQRKLLEDAERKVKEAQAKIEADKKALEDAKKAEKERQDRAEFERRAQEEAKAKAEVEAKAKVEREAKEKVEREEKERIERERQEALRPDKEKIINFITALMKIPVPDVGTESAKQLVDTATTALKKWASKLMKQAEAL